METGCHAQTEAHCFIAEGGLSNSKNNCAGPQLQLAWNDRILQESQQGKQQSGPTDGFVYCQRHVRPTPPGPNPQPGAMHATFPNGKASINYLSPTMSNYHTTRLICPESSAGGATERPPREPALPVSTRIIQQLSGGCRISAAHQPAGTPSTARAPPKLER